MYCADPISTNPVSRVGSKTNCEYLAESGGLTPRRNCRRCVDSVGAAEAPRSGAGESRWAGHGASCGSALAVEERRRPALRWYDADASRDKRNQTRRRIVLVQ